MNKWKQWINQYGLFLLSLVLIITIWQWAVQKGWVASFILPSPTAIVQSFIDNRQALLTIHLPVTIEEVAIGFILSLISGIAIGVTMHVSRTVEKILFPMLIISQTIPLVAISPIFIMWFGYTIWSKVAVTILTAFFPIVISTYDGLKRGGEAYHELLLTMGASKWDIFKTVRIPFLLPVLLSGMKMSIVYCVIGATIGEWLGASEGLGYFSRRMSGNLQSDALFASICLLSILGMLLFLIISVVEKQVLKRRLS